MAVQVAVCGPGQCDEREAQHARRVGELLAERGAVVLCGGGAGVMAAVAAGVRSRGGTIIGIRPDLDRRNVAADLTAVISTNLGQARNAIVQLLRRDSRLVERETHHGLLPCLVASGRRQVQAIPPRSGL